MAVTSQNLIALAPELDKPELSDALQAALDAVPLIVNLGAWAEKADLLTVYMALHILALQGFGKGAQGRVVSKSAAGVSITYASAVESASSMLASTSWGRLYRLAVAGYALRGGVT